MHFSAKVACLSLLAAHASAKTIKIVVGKNGLDYNPNSVKADKGDILEYHFYSMHSVAMSDWSKGCTPPATGGFFSGVVQAAGSSASKQVFQVTVNDTKPIAFYCTVANHCQSGMVGVVNPTSDDSLEKYKDTAKSAKANTEPDGVSGGVMVDSSSATKSGSGSMTMTTQAGTASGGAASQTTAATTSSTGAAAQLQGPVAGVGALAMGIAAFLV